MYEALRVDCENLLEQMHLEEQRKKLDRLYGNGSMSTALAATPQKKGCFFGFTSSTENFALTA